MLEQSDLDLIEETRAGSSAAFDELMGRYERLVYKVCYGYTGNQEDSLDVTQNVFIKAYQKLDSFRATGSFKSWLLRITRNEGIDWTRRHAKDKNQEEFIPERGPSCEAPQLSEVARREHREELMRSVSCLNPKQREAVVLRYFEGMSIKEISSVLGCSEGTTKSHLFRGINKLRDIVEPQWSES
jgi:RNA polymerase sigma-70 factor (ECF subfamily)